MRNLLPIILGFIFIGSANGQTLQTFHDFSAETILGDTLSMSTFAGKKVLVVNTASFCAYTPQFADLQALDSIYSPYNFEVIGFPCNDFGSQDPHDDSTIYNYCTGIYGVTFEMMSKISITAPDTHDIYKWLQLQSLNGVANAPVTWNFNKFCIDENGNWIMHFPEQTSPLDTAITNWIISGGPSGVQQNLNVLTIQIKNNPADGYFEVSIKNVTSAHASVTIYSIDGIKIDDIYSGMIDSEINIPFDAGRLANGIYFVKALIENNTSVFKIIVSH